MEFPRLVYKSASTHAVADDITMFDALIAAGWFASVPEALAPAVQVVTKVYSDGSSATGTAPLPELSPDQQDAAAPTRAELEQKANELGVEFSPRIGDAKLAERIGEAIAAKG